jgi:hypothetical protein
LLARRYQPQDAPLIDEILGEVQRGDVRLDRDQLIVCGDPAYGLLCWRAGGIVHELHTGRGLSTRRTANSLVNFAIADATSRPFPLHEAIFVTDSEVLARYVEGLGAIEEKGKRIYTLRLRP